MFTYTHSNLHGHWFTEKLLNVCVVVFDGYLITNVCGLITKTTLLNVSNFCTLNIPQFGCLIPDRILYPVWGIGSNLIIVKR